MCLACCWMLNVCHIWVAHFSPQQAYFDRNIHFMHVFVCSKLCYILRSIERGVQNVFGVWAYELSICSCLILNYSICCWIVDIKPLFVNCSAIPKIKFRKIIRNTNIFWCSAVRYELERFCIWIKAFVIRLIFVCLYMSFGNPFIRWLVSVGLKSV